MTVSGPALHAMNARARLRPAAAAAALALALAACATEPARQAGPVSVSTADAPAAARLVSAWRAAHGLGPVRVDPALNAPAAEQAAATARLGRLDHGDFAGRMARYGAPGAAAENLGAGARDAAAAIERWKRSAGHNRNMLDPKMRRIGFARADAPGQRYGTFWALVLAE
ncbi:CAP domain-containing protein [Camelimonas abortus]|uniref:CAP domain-containing protein n=1 Tax=Camelimonas abortus TaxID=1017184 RepID=A0ABV7LHP2_9HYPH